MPSAPVPAVLSALALTTLLGCSADTLSLTDGAFLVADPPELEVRADKTEVLEASLRLTNRGSLPVELLKLTATCACTTPRMPDKSRLAPGESTVVTVGVNPMSYGTRETLLKIATDLDSQSEIRIPINIKGPPLNPPYVRHAPVELSQRIERIGEGQTFPFAIICIERNDEGAWLEGCDSRSSSGPKTISRFRSDPSRAISCG
jgi:hypothetical protein